MIGEVGIITDHLPVMASLSLEARMPLPSCEMEEGHPPQLLHPLYGSVFSNPDVITICCGDGAGAPLNCGGLAGAVQP